MQASKPQSKSPMPAEKATGLVLRTTDWSETSRIATLWTRELGKVRVLAKGGRRLKSNFESALDLLNVCSIVLLRKSSGSLDLLTEARVVQRFAQLRTDLPALYAAYYIAELLADWTEDYDPHPVLFDEALDALGTLGTAAGPSKQAATALRLARFELVLLRELGYSPVLEKCAACGSPLAATAIAFSPAVGGVLCAKCQALHRDRRPLSREGWDTLRALNDSSDAWQQPWGQAARQEVRQLLGQYVTYLLGRRPRLLPYLGS
jgi:DNA repair protein RecO (recombination protein O)